MASLLVVFILFIRLLFGKMMKFWVHTMLWWLVIARLLLPFAPESPFSIFNLFSWHPVAFVTLQPIEPALTSQPLDFSESPEEPSSSGQGVTAPVAVQEPGLTGTGNPGAVQWTLWDYGLIIWLLGVMIAAIMMVRSNQRFIQYLKAGSPITQPATLDLFDRCKNVMGVKAPIALFETNAVSGPTLFGVFRARLLLPKATWESFTEEELTYIFYHELAHFRRRDIAFNGVFTGLLILHWFNPILWYGYFRMREDQELACDSLALSFIPAEQVRSYGHTIIRLAEVLSAYRSTEIVPFSFGKSQLKTRIQMIKNFRSHRRRLSILGVVSIIVLAGCLLTNAKQTPLSANSSNSIDDDLSSDSFFIPIPAELLDQDINWVSEVYGEQSGILDKEFVTVGGIHLGDTKQVVWETLNNPDEVTKDPQSREDIWRYNKYHATLYFYKISPDYPAEGVVRIQIENPSEWKTDTGIGIGDTLQQIKNRYSNINGTQGSATNRTVWINGGNVAASGTYYPTLKFKLEADTIQQIELTNQNLNPGPYHKKPLSYTDTKIGDIQIGDSSDLIKSLYGEPSQKDDTMTGPQWIFTSQGVVLGIDPVWLIRVTSPFKGNTSRGIHIGSTKEEVMKAYPDSFSDGASHDWLVQNSTDRTLQMVFEFNNNKVTTIAIWRDSVLGNY